LAESVRSPSPPNTGRLIERIGVALDANPADLLRAAGRYSTGMTFEATVLARLDALNRDICQMKNDLREVKIALVS
jgi:hypothetical protein